MTAKEWKFKNPPASEVGLSVTFPNNLEIADSRAKFHGCIRTEFPHVIMPEHAKLPYDFGDYSLYTQDLSNRLEIGMSYFRAVSSRYPGFTEFCRRFLDVLEIFASTYQLSALRSFVMQYRNVLPTEPTFDYEDYFRIDVYVPPEVGAEFYTGTGTLVFRKGSGLLVAEIQSKMQNQTVSSYEMNLTFAVQRELRVDEITGLTEEAHRALREFFFGILTPKYLEVLEAK